MEEDDTGRDSARRFGSGEVSSSDDDDDDNEGDDATDESESLSLSSLACSECSIVEVLRRAPSFA